MGHNCGDRRTREPGRVRGLALAAPKFRPTNDPPTQRRSPAIEGVESEYRLRAVVRDGETAIATSWKRITMHLGETVGAGYGLSSAEREILVATLRGYDRAAILATRHVSVNTLKTQIRNILLKTRENSLSDLRDRILRSLAEVQCKEDE